jgi:HTH-type transcriptional regulator/antitoxin HigA
MVETITPTTNANFNADWASPPGDLIEEVLEEHGWTRAELAQRLAFSPKHVNELLKGRASITADTAERLARYFGGDAASWLALQADYDLKTLATRDDIARKVSPREAASA